MTVAAPFVSVDSGICLRLVSERRASSGFDSAMDNDRFCQVCDWLQFGS